MTDGFMQEQRNIHLFDDEATRSFVELEGSEKSARAHAGAQYPLPE
jgi:hypothetical protein